MTHLFSTALAIPLLVAPVLADIETDGIAINEEHFPGN